MAITDDVQDAAMTGHKYDFTDFFLGSGVIDSATTGTGSASVEIGQWLASTGITALSSSMSYYMRQIFNPRYGRLLIKARVSDMTSCDMFIGFKSSLSPPSWGMTESCAGIYINSVQQNGTAYWYVGNGSTSAPRFKAVALKGLDMTDWLIFDISSKGVRWWAVPEAVPYFDTEAISELEAAKQRRWSDLVQAGGELPGDELHYVLLYVKNKTGATRYVEVQKLAYKEDYPD